MTPLAEDTICAISTAPGVGGIAVARVSGADAVAVVDKIWGGTVMIGSLAPRTSHLGTIYDTQGKPLDQALVTVFRAPASYTGEDVVEIAVHGSRWIQQELIAALVKSGARLAEPGEFTRRAFASGRIDLAEAEGVADLIASRSRGAHRLAMNQMRGALSRRLATLRDSLLQLASLLELELDFSEEEVEFASRERLMEIARATLDEVKRLERSFSSGSAIRDGIPIALVGATNVGKSSLLNALVEDDRAIVSDIHGTTRDIVEDTVNIGDYQFRILDTAGLRETTDEIENLGIKRTLQAAQKAHVVIFVYDGTDGDINPENIRTSTEQIGLNEGSRLIFVINKTDIARPKAIDKIRSELESFDAQILTGISIIPLSAKTGEGIDRLRSSLLDIAKETAGSSDLLVTNERHRQALENASESLSAVIAGLESGISADFIAQDLREALSHLGEITGAITSADILASIFSRFCIGK